MADRDALLASMTDEVAELVLAHNYDQNLALANAVYQAVVDGRRARGLDGAAGGPGAARPGDRVPARPPTSMEVRRASHKGLTAPELATLMAYTKIVLEPTRSLASDLPDDPYLADRLDRLLPDRAARALRRPDARAPAAPGDHRHRRGQRLRQPVRASPASTGCPAETGAGAADVIRAQIAARAIFGAGRLDDAIVALDHQVDGRGADRAADGGAHPGRAGHPLAGQQPTSADRHRRRPSSSSPPACRPCSRRCPTC